MQLKRLMTTKEFEWYARKHIVLLGVYVRLAAVALCIAWYVAYIHGNSSRVRVVVDMLRSRTRSCAILRRHINVVQGRTLNLTDVYSLPEVCYSISPTSARRKSSNETPPVPTTNDFLGWKMSVNVGNPEFMPRRPLFTSMAVTSPLFRMI